MSILSEIISTANNAPAFDIRTDVEETVRRITPQPQADMRRLNLRSLTVGDVLNAGSDAILPAPGNAGTKTRIASDVISLNSRAVAAGAHIVLIADAIQPIQDSAGKIAFVERPGGFVVAEPAQFAKVNDGAAVSGSAIPAHKATMDRSVAPAFMFRTTLSRRETKRWMNGELEDGVLLSILMGLGRMVDKVLLDAIAAAAPSAFTVAAAAARGLKYSDLRALVGTNGAGAFVTADGQLAAYPFNTTGWAGGVPGELTADMAGTIVGDFGRAAVGLFQDISLIGQRTTADGAMTVTCIANAEALLPVTGALLPFWSI